MRCFGTWQKINPGVLLQAEVKATSVIIVSFCNLVTFRTVLWEITAPCEINKKLEQKASRLDVFKKVIV